MHSNLIWFGFIIQVTIFGESAGAISIAIQLLGSHIKGLARGAVSRRSLLNGVRVLISISRLRNPQG